MKFSREKDMLLIFILLLSDQIQLLFLTLGTLNFRQEGVILKITIATISNIN